MLKIIYGTAGSGKTWHLHNLIAQFVESGEKGIVLLVPEQNNYENERAMLRLLGGASADVVEVASFTSLARSVAALCGADAVSVADEGVKLLMMSRAARSVKETLHIYGNVVNNKEFCKNLIDLHSEMKRSLVSTEDFVRVAPKLNGAVTEKLQDISLILSVYEGMLNRRFSDSLDTLDRLYEQLNEVDCFKDRTVCIDSFTDFTEQQYRIIERIIRSAKDVYLTICTDSLNDADNGMGLFSNNKRAVSRIIDIANECGVAVASPQQVSNNFRFNGSGVSAVEQLVRGESIGEGVDGDVIICSCPTRYEEADYVASTIRRLVRTENMRYRDFAVIARDINAYHNTIVDAFGHYNVPCFSDMRVDASSLALFRFVLCAIECAKGSIRNESILPFIKSPLSPISVEEASELENYALMWGKNGSKWYNDWTENPNGLEEKFDADALKRINGARERIIEPIIRLNAALVSEDIKVVCRGVYDLLIETGADKALKQYAARFDEHGEFYYADLHRRSWDALINCIDNIVKVFEGDVCDTDEFCDLFELMLNTCDIGAIPDRIDEVIIGSADRIRAGNPKITFIVGANYGEFPRPAVKGGLLTFDERQKIISHQLRLPDYRINAAVDERYYVYTALSSASHKIYITYHTVTGDGEGTPSEFIKLIQNNINGVTTLKYRDTAMDRFEGVLPAIELVASDAYCVYAESLYRQLDSRGIEAPELVTDLGVRKVDITPKTARALYGKSIHMSASKAEQFAKCPFSFFCEYGVSAKPINSAEMDVMRRGTLVHYVLEKAVQTHGKGLATISGEERRSEIARLVRQYADITLGGYDTLDIALLFMLERIALLLDHVIARLGKEFSVSDYDPKQCELYIGSDENPALQVPLDEGNLVLTGKVDRVDIFESEGKKYLRIVDYKSGGKQFDLSDVFYGMNMQMLIYLFTLTNSGSYKGAVPAGILYMPSKRPIHTTSDKDELANIKKMDADMRMNGLLADDAVSLTAMDKELSGRFVPYAPDGKKNSVIEAADLELVGKLVVEMLKKAGNSILSGCADIRPTDSVSSKSVCKYCNYRSVCLISDEADHGKVEKLKPEEAIEKLRRSEIGGQV